MKYHKFFGKGSRGDMTAAPKKMREKRGSWQLGRSTWRSNPRYKQGERECSRRLRQLEAGIIPRDQCYVAR
jgi:hypothetical protein